MIEGRIAHFKINPGLYTFRELPRSHYFHVHIFEQPEFMWAYAQKIVPDIKNHQNKWGALVSPHPICQTESNKNGKYFPKIGNILLWQGQLSTKVVPHEAVHAATTFLRICNKLNLGSQIDEHEEMLAHCVGSITTQIYQKIYALGIAQCS